MKRSSVLFVLAALLLAFCSKPMWPQAVSAKIEGRITDNGSPVMNAQIALTNTVTAKVYKMKTDNAGAFWLVGIPAGDYKVEIASATGESLITVSRQVKGGPSATVLNLDITRDRQASAKPAMSKEQLDALKAQREQALTANALISQAHDAMNAKNWQGAIAPLQQLIAMEPKSWDSYQALGNAHYNLGHYQEAVDAFEKGIANAKAALAAGDSKSDPVKIKTAMGQMLANQGNAYLKLRKSDLAITSYTKAAEIDPKPALAYFNLCATLYNAGEMDKVVGACDKAIAADPLRADAYFIKGSVLYANTTVDANKKMVVPPDAISALKKYLELAPQGGHAGDVKEMLAAVGTQ
jgi:tetratricopeptide (TPR) repeat protein